MGVRMTPKYALQPARQINTGISVRIAPEYAVDGLNGIFMFIDMHLINNQNIFK